MKDCLRNSMCERLWICGLPMNGESRWYADGDRPSLPEESAHRKVHGISHSGNGRLFGSMLREHKRSCLQRPRYQPLGGTLYREDKRSL